MTCPKSGGRSRFRGNFPPNDTERWQCTVCGHKFRVLDQTYRDLPSGKADDSDAGWPRGRHPRPECDSSAPPGADRR